MSKAAVTFGLLTNSAMLMMAVFVGVASGCNPAA